MWLLSNLLSFDKQGCDFTIYSGVGWYTFIALELNASLFKVALEEYKKHALSNMGKKSCNLRKTVLCDSITLQYIQSLPETIALKYYKLWHQVLMVIKITVEDFEKIVTSPYFLQLTSINWLVLKIRSCFDK